MTLGHYTLKDKTVSILILTILCIAVLAIIYHLIGQNLFTQNKPETPQTKTEKGWYGQFMKSLFDRILAILALIVLSPVVAVLIILIRYKLGTPVLFKQMRPGFKGKAFTIYKFRTMNRKADANGNLLADAERLTAFGHFLRSASLDELPELINVIKGDMSLVGPRPLLMKYLERYNDHQYRRHEVKPGITGLAQVNGRNSLNWEEKFDYDVWYVDHANFLLDIKIMALTVIQVLQRKNINETNGTTMSEFSPVKQSDDS